MMQRVCGVKDAYEYWIEASRDRKGIPMFHWSNVGGVSPGGVFVRFIVGICGGKMSMYKVYLPGLKICGVDKVSGE
jgi:hypothetical protein